MKVNRIEMRNYYRKCAGYLSLMNAIFVMVASCLAIYIADFDELDVDEGTGVIMLNGLYFVFVVGAVFAVISLVAGIMSVRGNGEGIFHFQRFISFVIAALMFFSFIISIYVVRNQEIEWNGESRAVTAVYLIVSLFAVVYGILTFLYSHGGMKYYDSGKKFAKDAPDMDAGRPARVELGIALMCGAVLNIAIAFLAYYFRNMIRYYDKTMVEQNQGFSGFYTALFVMGLAVAGISIIISVLHFVINKNELLKAGLAAALGNALYLLVFMAASGIAMTKDFVKSQSPDVSYIIFAFLLCIFSILYLIAAIGKVLQAKKAE